MKKLINFNIILFFFILLIGSFYQVFASEEVEIKISTSNKEWTNSDILVIIDIITNKIIEEESNVAVQILLGEESDTNTWIDLGTGTDTSVLKKTYTHSIKNNEKVSVRVITWKLQDKSDLEQLAIQTYTISNIDKTEPIIEKIDSIITNNSIKLNINAKDLESGISKYTCQCETLGLIQTLEEPNFEFANLENNKEYVFNITVYDKLENKKEETVKFVTQNEEMNDLVLNTENNITPDNTIANTIIPQIGTKNILFIIILLGIFAIVLKNER